MKKERTRAKRRIYHRVSNSRRIRAMLLCISLGLYLYVLKCICYYMYERKYATSICERDDHAYNVTPHICIFFRVTDSCLSTKWMKQARFQIDAETYEILKYITTYFSMRELLFNERVIMWLMPVLALQTFPDSCYEWLLRYELFWG